MGWSPQTPHLRCSDPCVDAKGGTAHLSPERLEQYCHGPTAGTPQCESWTCSRRHPKGDKGERFTSSPVSSRAAGAFFTYQRSIISIFLPKRLENQFFHCYTTRVRNEQASSVTVKKPNFIKGLILKGVSPLSVNRVMGKGRLG